jgi:beta-N-acetylhexosaminidase
MVGADPGDPSAVAAMLRQHPYLGGVFVGGDDTAFFTDAALRSLVSEGSWLVSVDDEGGRVQRIEALAGPMPSARRQGSLDPARIRQLARDRGERLRSLGVNMNLAPVADVSARAAGEVIGDRSFSDDAGVVSASARAFADGLADAGVVSTLKHFPGHGRADGDSHARPVRTPPLAELDTVDLVPFRELAADADAVMLGHLDVPGLTEPGLPASLSPAAYGLLRDDIGFTGVAVTDDIGGMRSVTDRFPAAEAAVRAAAAGADLVLIGDTAGPVAWIDALEAAVADGRLGADRVDEALGRVLVLKESAGLPCPPAPR